MMIKTMFDKILLGIVGLLFASLIGVTIYAKYYKYKSDTQQVEINNMEVKLEVSKIDENLTSITKYAEGAIDNIDKEKKHEAFIDYGIHTDSF